VKVLLFGICVIIIVALMPQVTTAAIANGEKLDSAEIEQVGTTAVENEQDALAYMQNGKDVPELGTVVHQGREVAAQAREETTCVAIEKYKPANTQANEIATRAGQKNEGTCAATIGPARLLVV